jgi:integrase/recombinase XerD
MNTDLVTLFQQTDIAPLESVQNALAPSGMLNAKSDSAAIAAWLLNHRDSPRTLINYQKEAGRLLLWAAARGKSLRQLRFEDIIEYREFLAHPPEDWISKTKFPRHDKRWRPFSEPLSPASVKQAMTTCNSLFNWLVRGQYLAGNPFGLTRAKRSKSQKKVTRFITGEQYFELLKTIEGMEKEPERVRARWIFVLLYLTLGRISEVANAKMGDFHQRKTREGQMLWWLKVTGKGEKEADIPVTDELLQELMNYRIANKLPALPTYQEKNAVIMRLDGDKEKPLTNSMIHHIIKQVTEETENRLKAEGRESDASIIGHVSAHWFRHAAASELALHIDIPSLREILRHSSIETTSIYIHTEEDRRHNVLNQNHKLPTA